MVLLVIYLDRKHVLCCVEGPHLIPFTSKAQAEEDPEVDEDPFDTSIVDKVIPVRKAQKRSEISVEDQDFDPTKSFKVSEVEIDPFDTSAAGAVIPELAEKKQEDKAPETIRYNH